MGNRQSLLQQINIYKPPFDELEFKDKGNLFKIYQHKFKGYELMAHKVTLNSQKQLPYLIQNFKARYQHHYLVSTLFLAIQDYSACGGYYESVIFYQRIFTNLSKIKDIPFQDVLHFYAVAFKGFQILYHRFGYFQIYEDMFHLGQDSKLKVWCNKDISKNQPESYLLDKNGTEEDMLRKIIFIISQNTDPYTDRINLKDKLLQFGVRNFQMAHQSLRQISRQFNLSVPERLQCISSFPSDQVKQMLDLYTSTSNYVFQNAQVSDLSVNLNNQLPVPTSSTNSGTIINHATPISIEGFMTPHFQRPEALHAPITQQFMIQKSQNKFPGLNFPIKQIKDNQQSMIHTFNRKLQMPQIDHRKGINLSLNQKMQRKKSYYSQNNLGESRNKSNLVVRNLNLIPQNYSRVINLEKKPEIKFNIVNKNEWINPKNQAVNISKKFDRTLHPSQIIPGQNLIKKIDQIRSNYHVQSNQRPIVVQPSKSRIIYVQSPQPKYYSQPHSNHQGRIINNSLFHNSNLYENNQSYKPNQTLRKSNHSVQFINSKNQNPQFQNNQTQFLKTNNQLDLYQFRQRRASNKQKQVGKQQQINQQQFADENKNKSINQFRTTQNLSKNFSNPVLIKYQQNKLANKIKENPFLTVDNKFIQPSTPIHQVINQNNHPQANKLHLQVPLNPSLSPQFNAHSASSRYLYSNKQLNDNIPDLKYKKPSSPKKMIHKLFDNKIQQIQSFNESKFGTQNSLKDQNSRVLQIIGREKKDSITSAFDQHQNFKNNDEVKQYKFQNNKTQFKLQNSYKYGDSFTDPKILEILKRPSSKALKNQLNTIKKVSKTTKPFDFSHEIFKRPIVNKQIKQDMLKLDSWQVQNQKNKQFGGNKNNFGNLQGFPSLSNLSEINKLEQNSFNEERVNLSLSNKKNMSKKSKFSEQKGNNKKQQNGVSEFYNFDYQSPTYDYSFSSKRQVPIQDNEWRAKYGTSVNSIKDDLTTVMNRTNDFRVVPQKPFSYLTGFNSNESLASLQYELSQKISNKNLKDKIKQSFGNQNQFTEFKQSSSQVTSASVSRKYNPRIDPQISRDLQRFRKQKQQIKNK